MSTINRQFRIEPALWAWSKRATSNTPKATFPTSPTDRLASAQRTCLSTRRCADRWKTTPTTWRRSRSATSMRAGEVAGVVDASRNKELPVGALVAGSLACRTTASPTAIVAGARVSGRHRSNRCARRARRHRHDGVLRAARSRRAEAGQTVVVSGAAGATGSVAGQIARIKGAAWSASRAALRNVRGSPMSSGSTRRSTTSRRDVGPRSTQRVPTASTSISTTSAARSSTSVSPASQ